MSKKVKKQLTMETNNTCQVEIIPIMNNTQD